MMYKIAVCDDEIQICAQIEKIILDYSRIENQKISVDVYESGKSLCMDLEREEYFDLIFLDIEMKVVNGVEVGEFLRTTMDNQTTQIVYVSGKEQYYRELFEVRPMHFLLKPFTKEEIVKDVKMAMRLSKEYNRSFSYTKGTMEYRIPIKNIIYFESISRAIRIVHTNGDDVFYGKLNDILQELKEYRFIQIHKSYLINHFNVKKYAYEKVIMTNETKLPISAANRKIVRERRLNFGMEDFE